MRANYWIKLHKIQEFLREPWQYLLGMVGIAVLSLCLVIGILLRVYAVFSLNLNTQEEIKKVSLLAMRKQVQVVTLPSSTDQMNLFGSALPKVVAPSNYVLLGIDFPDENPSHAKAIISINSGEGNVYSVGDSIQQGTVISEITPDKVYLSHNGIIQILDLSWDATDSSSAQTEGGDSEWP